jgi:hypothetical protein
LDEGNATTYIYMSNLCLMKLWGWRCTPLHVFSWKSGW